MSGGAEVLAGFETGAAGLGFSAVGAEDGAIVEEVEAVTAGDLRGVLGGDPDKGDGEGEFEEEEGCGDGFGQVGFWGEGEEEHGEERPADEAAAAGAEGGDLCVECLLTAAIGVQDLVWALGQCFVQR